MALWDWLFGVMKGRNDAMQTRFEPGPAVPPTSSGATPQMTSIQVSVPSTVRPVFGIQTAIELMRSLPVDENPELVLRVVRKTLRSTGVELEDVVRSAYGQEDALVGGVATDRAAIELLDQQIALRKANIERLEAELAETRKVRARLEEAMEGETKVGNAIPPAEILKIRAEAASRPPPPKPAAPPVPPSKKSLPPKVPLPSAASAPPPSVAKKDESAKELAKKDEPAKKEESPKDGDARLPMSSLPDLESIDEGFDETTAKVEIDASAAKRPDDK